MQIIWEQPKYNGCMGACEHYSSRPMKWLVKNLIYYEVGAYLILNKQRLKIILPLHKEIMTPPPKKLKS